MLSYGRKWRGVLILLCCCVRNDTSCGSTPRRHVPVTPTRSDATVDAQKLKLQIRADSKLGCGCAVGVSRRRPLTQNPPGALTSPSKSAEVHPLLQRVHQRCEGSRKQEAARSLVTASFAQSRRPQTCVENVPRRFDDTTVRTHRPSCSGRRQLADRRGGGGGGGGSFLRGASSDWVLFGISYCRRKVSQSQMWSRRCRGLSQTTSGGAA